MNIQGKILAALLLLIVSFARAQTVEYIHTDALGSPVAVTNAAGNLVIERTVYEPYGAVINRPVTNGPGYTGHVMDAVTGLNYMQQRYYDPQVGKFLSVDPVTAYGGDNRFFNRYTYAFNNPYLYADSTGRAPNQAGAASYTTIEAELRANASLDALSANHLNNSNRYFYTQEYGWVDVRHFAAAAAMTADGTWGWVTEGLGLGNETVQWLTEWGGDYRSGFSPEDLPSNSAGADFGKFFRSGTDPVDVAFASWAKSVGARDPSHPASGYGNLPATDPSEHGGAGRGSSNASSGPPGNSGSNGSNNSNGSGSSSGSHAQSSSKVIVCWFSCDLR